MDNHQYFFYLLAKQSIKEYTIQLIHIYLTMKFPKNQNSYQTAKVFCHNKYPKTNRSPNHYFDKLKQKINTYGISQYETITSQVLKPLSTKRPDKLKTTGNGEYRKEAIYQRFCNLNRIKEKKWEPSKHFQNSIDEINTDKSIEKQKVNTTYLLQNNRRIDKSQRKKGIDDIVFQIKDEIMNRQWKTPNKTSDSYHHGKGQKYEKVNYAKFIPMNVDDEFERIKIAENWGKMQLKNVLGKGANAQVRLGISHNANYAVKVYEKYKLIDPKRKKRVYKEIQLLQNLPLHPNIISLVEAFENSKQIHMIFEHLNEAQTLLQYFRQQMLYLQERQIKQIFHKILKGVYHLHSHQVAHRDIKPDNVLIAFNEDSSKTIKIIDFGFATKSQRSDLHCGTPNFMAPELLEKDRIYSGFSVDVWALGVTLFYLCQGRYPFRGYDEKDLFRNIKKGQIEIKKTKCPYIIDLLKKTLVAEAQRRLTIQEMINHKWFDNS